MKLPVVALRDMTVLPGMLMHFDVSREKSISAAEYAMNEDRQIFLTCQKDENTEDPEEDDLFRTGTVEARSADHEAAGRNYPRTGEGQGESDPEESYGVGALPDGRGRADALLPGRCGGRTGSDDPYTEGWHPGVCAAEPCIRRRRSEVSAYLSERWKG